jgi:hypothetical protein
MMPNADAAARYAVCGRGDRSFNLQAKSSNAPNSGKGGEVTNSWLAPALLRSRKKHHLKKSTFIPNLNRWLTLAVRTSQTPLRATRADTLR